MYYSKKCRVSSYVPVLSITLCIMLSMIAVGTNQPSLYASSSLEQPEPLITSDPTMTNGTWLHYDNGENVNSIGLTAGGLFEWGIRLTPEELASYDGLYLSLVRHHHGWSGNPVPYETSGEIRIYVGGIPTKPGELVYRQPYTVSEIDWFDVILDEPVIIDATQDLWVCISALHPQGKYPAGAGPGPAVPGKGLMATTDGEVWEDLSIYGFDYNWNLWAGLSDIKIVAVTGGLGAHAKLINIGDEVLTDINWEFHITGGILGLLNKTIQDTTSILPSKTSEPISTGAFLALGPIEIDIFAQANNSAPSIALRKLYAIAIGPLILLEK